MEKRITETIRFTYSSKKRECFEELYIEIKLGATRIDIRVWDHGSGYGHNTFYDALSFLLSKYSDAQLYSVTHSMTQNIIHYAPQS